MGVWAGLIGTPVVLVLSIFGYFDMRFAAASFITAVLITGLGGSGTIAQFLWEEGFQPIDRVKHWPYLIAVWVCPIPVFVCLIANLLRIVLL